VARRVWFSGIGAKVIGWLVVAAGWLAWLVV